MSVGVTGLGSGSADQGDVTFLRMCPREVLAAQRAGGALVWSSGWRLAGHRSLRGSQPGL